MNAPTPLEIVTLVIAVVGVVLAAATFAWQLAEWKLSGDRVKVQLLLGAIGRGGIVTMPMGTATAPLVQQGFQELVFVVRAINVGRLPTTVTNYDIEFDNGAAYCRAGAVINPDLPHRLESQSKADFHTSMDEVQKVLGLVRSRKPDGVDRIRPRVTLASGKTVQGPWETVAVVTTSV